MKLIGFIFTTVFHRILDFKSGLDFYPGPFFMLELKKNSLLIGLIFFLQ